MDPDSNLVIKYIGKKKVLMWGAFLCSSDPTRWRQRGRQGKSWRNSCNSSHEPVIRLTSSCTHVLASHRPIIFPGAFLESANQAIQSYQYLALLKWVKILSNRIQHMFTLKADRVKSQDWRLIRCEVHLQLKTNYWVEN